MDESEATSQIFKYLMAVMQYCYGYRQEQFGDCEYEPLYKLMEVPQVRETVFWFVRFPWKEAQLILDENLSYSVTHGWIRFFDKSGKLTYCSLIYIALALLLPSVVVRLYPMAQDAFIFDKLFFQDFLKWSKLEDTLLLAHRL